jgi:hypothetical protein
MTNIFNRINIPIETKLVNEKEFLFYKLTDERNICPKLKSFERQNGEFLIKYKTHNPITILDESKKDSVINLIKQLHNVGIFYGNICKDNIVYNEYEGVKLTDFSKSLWIDQIDKRFLLNNPYCTSCSNIEELLELELNKINEIFILDKEITGVDSTDELKIIDDHFHSSDEENVYY